MIPTALPFPKLLLAKLLFATISLAAPLLSSDVSRNMLQIPSNTFTMGRLDFESNFENSLPRHEVTLDTYAIGKYEVTNREFLAVLNWAHGEGLLKDSAGEPWVDGDLFINQGSLKPILDYTSTQCPFTFAEGDFVCATRTTNTGATVSLEEYPTFLVSWYGALAYCNWLSEIEGYSPAYDLSNWTLIDGDPTTPGFQFTNGYRLPTEAEWERAAGWDGAQHLIYGTGSTASNILSRQANYGNVNPMRLTTFPYITPVGFYDGVNVIPANSFVTFHSTSPAGAFDMSGNIMEWCHDRYGLDYYSVSPSTNPLGPDTDDRRVVRGGSWNVPGTLTRTAFRFNQYPEFMFPYLGFRVARSGAPIPTQPGVPTATIVSSNEIHWQWRDQSHDEDGFNLFINVGERTSTLPVSLAPDIESEVRTNLSPNTIYAMQVSSFSYEGESPRTSIVTARTFAAVPTTPVIDSVTSSSIALALSPDEENSPETEYAIHTGSTGNWVQIDGSLASTPFWQARALWGNVTIVGLESATLYDFRARARNSDNVQTIDGPAAFAGTHAILHYSAGPNGSLSGEVSQEIDYNSDGTPVIAIAHPGFRFFQWSDGSTENPRQDTNVTADVAVTAYFTDPALAAELWIVY